VVQLLHGFFIAKRRVPPWQWQFEWRYSTSCERMLILSQNRQTQALLKGYLGRELKQGINALPTANH